MAFYFVTECEASNDIFKAPPFDEKGISAEDIGTARMYPSWSACVRMHLSVDWSIEIPVSIFDQSWMDYRKEREKYWSRLLKYEASTSSRARKPKPPKLIERATLIQCANEEDMLAVKIVLSDFLCCGFMEMPEELEMNPLTSIRGSLEQLFVNLDGDKLNFIKPTV